MNSPVVDAVVIGAGPNGLVAANMLADAGWDVVLLEAAATPGGAVRSAEIAAPGFRADLCSAFYPFAACSPVISGLRLTDYGLRWLRADAVLAHALPSHRWLRPDRCEPLHDQPLITGRRRPRRRPVLRQAVAHGGQPIQACQCEDPASDRRRSAQRNRNVR